MASLTSFLTFITNSYLLFSWFVVLRPEHRSGLLCHSYAHPCFFYFFLVHSCLYQEKFLVHSLLRSCWWCKSVKPASLSGLPSSDTAWSSTCRDETCSRLLCMALQSFWIKCIRNEEHIIYMHLAVCPRTIRMFHCYQWCQVVAVGKLTIFFPICCLPAGRKRNQCSWQGSFMASCVDFKSCFGRVRELWESRCCQHHRYTSVLPPPASSAETGVMPMNTSVLPMPTIGFSPEDYIFLGVNN